MGQHVFYTLLKRLRSLYYSTPRSSMISEISPRRTCGAQGGYSAFVHPNSTPTPANDCGETEPGLEAPPPQYQPPSTIVSLQSLAHLTYTLELSSDSTVEHAP